MNGFDTLAAACLAFADRRDEIQILPGAADSAWHLTPDSEVIPYWFLRGHRRNEVARTWQAALKLRPNDMRIWHELAVLHYWQAKDLEERGEDAVSEWREAIGYWAGLLVSDAFWRTWAWKRAAPCDILPDDCGAVRTQFECAVTGNAIEPERVAEFCGTVTATKRAVRAELHEHFLLRGRSGAQAPAYCDLLIYFNHESAVAQRLERTRMAVEIAGHSLRQRIDDALEAYLSSALERQQSPDINYLLNTAYVFMDLHRVQAHDRIPACGLGMAASLSLENESLLEAGGKFNAKSTGLDRLLMLVFHDIPLLRIYLDPIFGRLLTMIDLGMYAECEAEAIALIMPGSGPPPSLSYDRRVAKKLLCFACFDEAKASLEHDDFETVLSAFQKADQYCFDVLKHPEPFYFDMPGLKKRTCAAIQAQYGRSNLTKEAARNLMLRLEQIALPAPLCGQFLQTLTT